MAQPTGTTNEDELVKTLGYRVVAGLAGIAGAILLAFDYRRRLNRLPDERPGS